MTQEEGTIARIKWAYIGGGSTRAPGTLAAFIAQGERFRGSEVVLVDLDEGRLELVAALARRMAEAQGLELSVRCTTDRRAALEGCGAVLSSFRPGGFEARHLDESIPLKHGVIGQETQGPGGLFMALRAMRVIKDLVAEMEAVCPDAVLLNYTNPVNVVADAATRHSPVQTLSLCEGPIVFPQELALAADLEPDKLDAVMLGLNHACWSVRHLYDGEDFIPLVRDAFERKKGDPGVPPQARRMLHLASVMGSVPASYFQYYYFEDEVLRELQAKPTTRAQDIMAEVGGYWQHYREQRHADAPQLDPARSRGGIFELELAFDVMNAIFNDLEEVWTLNVPNRGALPDLPDDLVVEVPALVNKYGATPLAAGRLPVPVRGLVSALGAYQRLAADAAWDGGRLEAVRALASHPLVLSLPLAERLYDEMVHAQRDWLPERYVT